MTLAETEQIFTYWERHPPVYLMLQAIARILGWKTADSETPSFEEFAAMAPAGLNVVGSSSLGMPAPELDVETLRARNQSHLANRRSNG